MQAVAASSTAMQAVAASSTAMQAVAASGTAKNALAASPLATTKTGQTCGSNYSMVTAVSSAAWIIQAWNSSTDTSSSIIMRVGNLHTGGHQVLGTLNNIQAPQTVGKFASTITFSTSSSSQLSYGGVKYIPC